MITETHTHTHELPHRIHVHACTHLCITEATFTTRASSSSKAAAARHGAKRFVRVKGPTKFTCMAIADGVRAAA